MLFKASVTCCFAPGSTKIHPVGAGMAISWGPLGAARWPRLVLLSPPAPAEGAYRESLGTSRVQSLGARNVAKSTLLEGCDKGKHRRC